jgi:hypothetical protein
MWPHRLCTLVPSTQSVITTLTTGTYVPPSLYLFQFSGTGTSTPPHDTFDIREYVHTTLSILLRYLNVLVTLKKDI